MVAPVSNPSLTQDLSSIHPGQPNGAPPPKASEASSLSSLSPQSYIFTPFSFVKHFFLTAARGGVIVANTIIYILTYPFTDHSKPSIKEGQKSRMIEAVQKGSSKQKSEVLLSALKAAIKNPADTPAAFEVVQSFAKEDADAFAKIADHLALMLPEMKLEPIKGKTLSEEVLEKIKISEVLLNALKAEMKNSDGTPMTLEAIQSFAKEDADAFAKIAANLALMLPEMKLEPIEGKTLSEVVLGKIKMQDRLFEEVIPCEKVLRALNLYRMGILGEKEQKGFLDFYITRALDDFRDVPYLKTMLLAYEKSNPQGFEAFRIHLQSMIGESVKNIEEAKKWIESDKFETESVRSAFDLALIDDFTAQLGRSILPFEKWFKLSSFLCDWRLPVQSSVKRSHFMLSNLFAALMKADPEFVKSLSSEIVDRDKKDMTGVYNDICKEEDFGSASFDPTGFIVQRAGLGKLNYRLLVNASNQLWSKSVSEELNSPASLIEKFYTLHYVVEQAESFRDLYHFLSDFSNQNKDLMAQLVYKILLKETDKQDEARLVTSNSPDGGVEAFMKKAEEISILHSENEKEKISDFRELIRDALRDILKTSYQAEMEKNCDISDSENAQRAKFFALKLLVSQTAEGSAEIEAAKNQIDAFYYTQPQTFKEFALHICEAFPNNPITLDIEKEVAERREQEVRKYEDELKAYNEGNFFLRAAFSPPEPPSYEAIDADNRVDCILACILASNDTKAFELLEKGLGSFNLS